MKQCLANRGPADAKFTHKLSLGRQLPAWSNFLVANPLFYTLGNVFI
jgi:hypothetical protein